MSRVRPILRAFVGRVLAGRRATHLWLSRQGAEWIGVIGVFGVALVFGVDIAAGAEISTSVFYLAPVAVAAWYGGRRMGIAIALLSCIAWYLADTISVRAYSHPAIPVWNAIVRLGFFLTCALLLTTLREKAENDRRLARTDALTGLCTRRAFEDRLAHDLALARRSRRPITLAYVDLDNFKHVNDRHGHARGDDLLRTVGAALAAGVRQVDTAARLGGDEFAVVLPETGESVARETMEVLLNSLRARVDAMGFGVGCSVGVVTFTQAPQSVAVAVAVADALMYEVKNGGKGAAGYRVFGDSASNEIVAPG
ncbi:MAG: diguanylate cyclase [Chromatiales bacterium]|nr:diguanylate cyclase [Chromatiales bacterium]